MSILEVRKILYPVNVVWSIMGDPKRSIRSVRRRPVMRRLKIVVSNQNGQNLEVY